MPEYLTLRKDVKGSAALCVEEQAIAIAIWARSVVGCGVDDVKLAETRGALFCGWRSNHWLWLPSYWDSVSIAS